MKKMEDIHPREQYNLLFEYYDRISKPQDNDVLGNWQVWIYGSDREAFPPHCHVRLPKGELEFEVSLLTWEVINIKNSDLPKSWDSISKDIRDGFFEWLTRPNKTDPSITNKKYIYHIWDGLNTENRFEKWVKKDDKDNLDDELLDCLGWNIDYTQLSKSVTSKLCEIYFQNKEERDRLHQLRPKDLLKELGYGIWNEDDAFAVVKQAETNAYYWSNN